MNIYRKARKASKKLEQVNGQFGLQAAYGGGDYTVSVYENMDGGYDMVFFRSNTDIAHSRETLDTIEATESRMRDFQPDLRKWRKIVYGE